MSPAGRGQIVDVGFTAGGVVGDMVKDLVRAVGGWCSRGLKQRWIGHCDAGRHVACPGRDNGGSVHRSLIGAFIGENGFGRNASERAVGLWLQ
jgi:hypothetical protein